MSSRSTMARLAFIAPTPPEAARGSLRPTKSQIAYQDGSLHPGSGLSTKDYSSKPTLGHLSPEVLNDQCSSPAFASHSRDSGTKLVNKPGLPPSSSPAWSLRAQYLVKTNTRRIFIVLIVFTCFPCINGHGPCSGLSCVIGCVAPNDVYQDRYIQSVSRSRSKTYSIGDKVYYECLYANCTHDSGVPFAMCKGDGTWSIPTLKCRCSCGSPPSIYKAAHNAVTNQNYIGSEVSYSCVKGYRDPEAGSMKRRCTYNKAATWVLIGQELFCEEISCPVLHDPDYGYIINKYTAIGTNIRYRCNRGYWYIGENQRTCQSDGTWTGQTGHCQAIDCGSPQIQHGTCNTSSGTDYPKMAKCRCFKRCGRSFVFLFCTFRGKWSPDPSNKCQECATLSETLVTTPTINKSLPRGNLSWTPPQNSQASGAPGLESLSHLLFITLGLTLILF